jgi:hypothetical protein
MQKQLLINAIKQKKTQLPESCLELSNLFDRDIMPSFEVF